MVVDQRRKLLLRWVAAPSTNESLQRLWLSKQEGSPTNPRWKIRFQSPTTTWHKTAVVNFCFHRKDRGVGGYAWIHPNMGVKNHLSESLPSVLCCQARTKPKVRPIDYRTHRANPRQTAILHRSSTPTHANYYSDSPDRRDEGRVIVRDFVVCRSPPAEGAATDHHGVYDVRQHIHSPQHVIRLFLQVCLPVCPYCLEAGDVLLSRNRCCFSPANVPWGVMEGGGRGGGRAERNTTGGEWPG